jgi:hypothetical protein
LTWAERTRCDENGKDRGNDLGPCTVQLSFKPETPVSTEVSISRYVEPAAEGVTPVLRTISCQHLVYVNHQSLLGHSELTQLPDGVCWAGSCFALWLPFKILRIDWRRRVPRWPIHSPTISHDNRWCVYESSQRAKLALLYLSLPEDLRCCTLHWQLPAS